MLVGVALVTPESGRETLPGWGGESIRCGVLCSRERFLWGRAVLTTGLQT